MAHQGSIDDADRPKQPNRTLYIATRHDEDRYDRMVLAAKRRGVSTSRFLLDAGEMRLDAEEGHGRSTE